MKIGLLTQWFDPEPGPAALPGALARGLRDRGHEVTVLTGFPNYPTGELAPGYRISRRQVEDHDGVRVVRVALHPAHGTSTRQRFANYASFGASAVLNGTSSLRGLDALWVNASPITVAWPLWAARLGLRLPTVTHFLDLWPDTLFAGGFGDGRVMHTARGLLDVWAKGIYKASDAVAYISPGVGPLLQARGVPADKLHYIPMWADESVYGRPATSQRTTPGAPRWRVT